MKTCGNCRYLVRMDTEYFGRCRNQKIAYDLSMRGPTIDGLAYWDNEGSGVTLWVGNEFGCIHWTNWEGEFEEYTNEGLVTILKANVGLSGLSNYGIAINKELVRRAETRHA